MQNLVFIKTILKQPSLLTGFKPILLLSHMRANTSLIGHILGSHPQINGYYEQHIGYYNWKSFIRQRLLFSQEHQLKPNSRYFFDKVLHSEHFVSHELLNRTGAKILISIRKPETTIPSIIKLYQGIDPSHDFCTVKGATTYYINRMKYLTNISQQLNDYYYYDAELLRNNTAECLKGISNFLGLSVPLSSEFKTLKFTGVGNAGDRSGNLNAAMVKKETTDYSNFDWNAVDISHLKSSYMNTKNKIA